MTNLPLAPAAGLPAAARRSARLRPGRGDDGASPGAAPLPESLREEFTERTGLRIEQGYGLTEAAPGVTATLGGRQPSATATSAAPCPGCEIRIGDGVGRRPSPARSGSAATTCSPATGPTAAAARTGRLVRHRRHRLPRRRRAVPGRPGPRADHRQRVQCLSRPRWSRSIARAARRGGRGRGRPPGPAYGGAGRGLRGRGRADRRADRATTATAAGQVQAAGEVLVVDELPRGATGKIRKGALRHSLGVESVAGR